MVEKLTGMLVSLVLALHFQLLFNSSTCFNKIEHFYSLSLG